ncbi:MAG TPA: autotransporter outer membrane beta-barrel domain-containing protein, partial [Allosphingosinicella sp.]
GGLGAAVSVAGGMTVNGQVTAVSSGGNALATAIHIGGGATVDEIRVGGTVQAEGVSGRAVQIDQGAAVAGLRNTGKIAAAASGSGTASAIADGSGKLSLVENSGSISASGVAAETGRAIAIDLRNNVSGATVRQTLVGQGVAAPSIAGNILFGAGNDLLDLADGEMKGDTKFGAGANRLSLGGDSSYRGRADFGSGADQMSLAGTSTFSGTVDFGGGADLLTLSGTSKFSGSLVNASGLAVQVNGGTLESSSTAPIAIGSLSVGAQGVLGAIVDPQAGKSALYQVAGRAAFAQGAKIEVKLANVGGALGKFTILKAGTLVGAAGLTSTSVLLPVFLKTSVIVDQPAGEIAVAIGRKSASEIGLNGSEGRAWDALFGALDKDSKVAGAFLEMREVESFREALQQMLPEHAGGVFETVTQGSRATARFLRDPGSAFADMGGWGFWLQQVAWGSSKDLGDTSAYDVTGWGAAGGAEVKLGGLGNAGLSLAYLAGRDEQDGNDNEVSADQYELGAYWRGQWGGLRAHARASAARIGFEGSRTFTGKVGTETVTRTALGDWDGNLVSAAAGLSYELGSGRLSLRPAASLDYYRLSEDGYSETGGGNAMNLVVDKRKSDELAAEASLTAGYSFGKLDRDGGWLRAEVEGGRRHILAGSIGETVARLGTGPAFTLLPERRSDGWLGRLRLLGGNSDFTLGAEIGAEEQQSRAAVSARVSLQAAF